MKIYMTQEQLDNMTNEEIENFGIEINNKMEEL